MIFQYYHILHHFFNYFNNVTFIPLNVRVSPPFLPRQSDIIFCKSSSVICSFSSVFCLSMCTLFLGIFPGGLSSLACCFFSWKCPIKVKIFIIVTRFSLNLIYSAYEVYLRKQLSIFSASGRWSAFFRFCSFGWSSLCSRIKSYFL